METEREKKEAMTEKTPCVVRMDSVQSYSVDRTTRELLKRLRELESEQLRLARDINAIRRALTLAGVRPSVRRLWFHEVEYQATSAFLKSHLTDACLQVLRDAKGEWLTKSEVEYLVTRGGYPFSTQDSANSVDVTLRRLATEGLCEAERVRGSRGNKYRYVPAQQTEKETASE